MTIANNCYFNAGIAGFIAGALSQRSPPGTGTATDYAALKNAAVAFATQLDSKIAFDALVTTANNDASMLVSSNHTIQSNTILRPALLANIVAGAIAGTFPTSTTAADYDTLAGHIAAVFTEALLGIVSP